MVDDALPGSAALQSRTGASDRDDLEATVEVENIGGIDSAAASVHPGVTILSGENATNRTSFLKALNAVLGGSEATVKTDANEGRVRMSFGDGETFTRELTRDNRHVTTTGAPYSDAEDVVDSFVTLLEANEARVAGERGEGLREVLMKPVDTDAIRHEIQEKSRERDQLTSRLTRIDDQLDKEAELTEKKTSIENDIEDIETEIAKTEELVDKYEADMEMAEEAESLIEELENERDRVRELESEIEVLTARQEALEEEAADLTDEQESLSVDIDESPEALQSRLDRLQGRRDELLSTIDDLERIVSFTDEVLDDAASLAEITASDDVTAELDPASKQVECWTCGSTVQQHDIENRLSELRDVVATKRTKLDDVESDIEATLTDMQEIERVQDRRDEINSRLDDIREQKNELDTEKAQLEDDIDDARQRIEELQTEVEETEELRESDLLEAYQELNELEFQRGQLEQELSDIESQLAEMDELRKEREETQPRIDELRSSLEDLRSRVEERERSVVEAFNQHMEDVLDLLQYENIERVWIERKVGNQNSSPVQEGTFDLHIVRESDGAVYDDTVDHLSQSEREVIGLMVALSGYLTHDVANEVPFLLLDSVEAIDSDRLVALVEYMADFAIYIVVALLPEDAAAFPDEYRYIDQSALAAE